MIEVFVFGIVLGFVGRAVLERGPETEKHATGYNPPINTTQPPKAPTTTAPPGWPSNISHADCEAYMATFSKEQMAALMQGMMTKTDAQWEVAKTQMTAMGQKQLAECLDGARSVVKTLKSSGM